MNGKCATIYKKHDFLYYLYNFQMRNLCPSSFFRVICCIFSVLARIFDKNKIKTKMSHLDRFVGGFFFFSFAWLSWASSDKLNKSLCYLLFITRIIYKALIYSSDIEVGMSHFLSKWCFFYQFRSTQMSCKGMDQIHFSWEIFILTDCCSCSIYFEHMHTHKEQKL